MHGDACETLAANAKQSCALQHSTGTVMITVMDTVTVTFTVTVMVTVTVTEYLFWQHLTKQNVAES
jgi:hypothetical protein